MLPAYLLDTNAVSDWMTDHPKVKAKVATPPGLLITSVIVRGEIYFGIERLPRGKRRDRFQARANHAFALLPSEPVTDQIADQYAIIRRATELKGLSLDDNDLWIAATAIVVDAILVTRDSDFANVPGLRTEDWTK